MFQKIKQFYSLLKTKILQAINILLNLVIKSIKKLLGQNKYAKLEAFLHVIYSHYEIRRNQIQAYYDARVDKNSPYYKPIVRVWRIAGKLTLYVLIYLFVIETNLLWLTGTMPSVDDLQNPKLSQASEIYSADGVARILTFDPIAYVPVLGVTEPPTTGVIFTVNCF